MNIVKEIKSDVGHLWVNYDRDSGQGSFILSVYPKKLTTFEIRGNFHSFDELRKLFLSLISKAESEIQLRDKKNQ